MTMLLTDVEGSTALLRRLGDRYGELLNDLRSILRDTAVRLRRRASSRPAPTSSSPCSSVRRSAVETAVAIQRELRARSWTDDLDVRVRIGIHSGFPTLAEGELHRDARPHRGAHQRRRPRWTDPRLGRDPRGRTRRGGRRSAIPAPRSSSGCAACPTPVSLFQVAAKGLAVRFAPPARRAPIV